MIDLRCEGRAVACRVAKTPSDLLGRRAQRECGSKLGRRVIASGRTAMRGLAVRSGHVGDL